MDKQCSIGVLKEAHLASPRERLTKTKRGRAILSRVGSTTRLDKERGDRLIPKSISKVLQIKPIPKDDHAKITKMEEQRELKALLKHYGGEKGAVCSDAAQHLDRDAFLVGIVDHEGKPVCAAIVPVRRPEDAETSYCVSDRVHGGYNCI